MEIPKPKPPNPKETPISQTQKGNPAATATFAYWSLAFAWSLGFGVWDLVAGHLSPTPKRLKPGTFVQVFIHTKRLAPKAQHSP